LQRERERSYIPQLFQSIVVDPVCILTKKHKTTVPETTSMIVSAAAVASVLAMSIGTVRVDAFRPTTAITRPLVPRSTPLFSSLGGGGKDDRPPSDGDGDLGDFLDPNRPPDSENLRRAREFMSETSLPLSFDEIDDENENDASTTSIDKEKSSSSLANASKFNNSASSSALFGTDGTPSSDILAKNPYMQVVSKISPSEVIAKFTATANPRVQEAVRTTILGLIGSLPKLAFETTSITTGQRLASLVRTSQLCI
jgi:hypothetical protein